MSHPEEKGSISGEEEVYRRIADAISKGLPAVVVTVIETTGSAPQKPGAKMLVSPDDQLGSIGGGAIENIAVEKARKLLSEGGGPEILYHDLSQDLGMCCGGSMRLFFEPLVPLPQLIIFGAGHISHALCTIATTAGFAVTVCDSRDEWLTQERFPQAKSRVKADLDEAFRSITVDHKSYLVLMTHDHDLDEEIAARILTMETMPFYLGMIGSRGKRARMRKRLAEKGIPQDRIDAVNTPVGLDIGGISPEEIAISIAAELVAMRRGKRDTSS